MWRLALLFVCVSLLAPAQETIGAAEMRRGEEARKRNTPAARREALAAYQIAADRFRESGDTTNLGLAKHSAGRILFDLGEYNQAIDELQRAIAIRRDGGKLLDLSNSIQTLGAAWSFTGETTKAMECYQEALAIRRSANDRSGMGTSLFGIAQLHWMWGDTQKAIRTYEDALQLRRETKDAYGEAHLLNAVGLAYASLGDHRTALNRYQQALAIWRRIHDRSGESYTLNNLGLVQAARGDHRSALTSYTQAIATLSELGDKRGVAYGLHNSAESHANLKQWTKASELYQQALEKKRELGDRYGEAISLQRVAQLQLDNHRPQDAVASAREALALHRTVGDRSGESAALAILAASQKETGDKTGAAESYAEALTRIELLRGLLSQQQLKAAHLESTQSYYDSYITLLMEMDRPEEALAVAERSRARVLLDQLAESASQIRHDADPKLLQRQKRLQAEINAAAQRIQQGGASARGQLDELLQAWDEVGGELRSSSPRYAGLVRPQPLSIESIRERLLDDDTALLEFHLGSTASFAWLVSRREISAVKLPSRRVIEALSRRLYDSLEGRGEATAEDNAEMRRLRLEKREQSFQESSHALSRMLLGGFAGKLGVRRLLIVADGVLHLTPFAALPLPKSGVPVVAKMEVAVLPSASILGQLRAARRSSAATLSVLADPVFQREDARFAESGLDVAAIPREPGEPPFPRLHFTRIEAQEIAHFVKPGNLQQAIDFNANRAKLLDPRFLRSRILHLATHAVIDTTRPALSGIAVSGFDAKGQKRDGFLRLYEIYNLPLQSELVVLSACRTALGLEMRGEGTIGLTRAFLYAGASTVVTSLWSIQDRATAQLMQHFYEGMLKRALPPAAALRRAQNLVRADTRFSHPYFWAAFSVQGDWR